MVAVIEKKTRKKRIPHNKRTRFGIVKKANETRVQNQALDGLYLLACKAPDIRSLYVLRSCRETKVLTRQNYFKFILLLDRLMESL